MLTKSVMDPRIDELTQDVAKIAAECPLTVATDADLQSATSWLVAVRLRRKKIEGFFAGLIKPIQAAVKLNQAKRDEVLAPLAERESKLNVAILGYRQKQQAEAAEAQRKANEAYDREVEKAIEKGKDVSLIAPPKQVEAPAKTVDAGIANVTFRKVKKFEVTNPDLIPDEYWVIDETKLGKVIRAGVEVPGCRIWDEEVTSVR